MTRIAARRTGADPRHTATRGVPTGRVRGEDGVTLVEMLVGMSLMVVFMTMFTTGMLALYRSTSTAEAISTAQSQLHVAFLRLDEEIRYAAEISEPDQVGADWYVEYRELTADGATCGQFRLRADGGLLQHRKWTEGSAPGSFGVLASNVTATEPFELIAGAPGSEVVGSGQFQQLKVAMRVSSRPDGAGTVKEMSLTFTALNAARTDPGAAACRVAGRAP